MAMKSCHLTIQAQWDLAYFICQNTMAIIQKQGDYPCQVHSDAHSSGSHKPHITDKLSCMGIVFVYVLLHISDMVWLICLSFFMIDSEASFKRNA